MRRCAYRRNSLNPYASESTRKIRAANRRATRSVSEMGADWEAAGADSAPCSETREILLALAQYSGERRFPGAFGLSRSLASALSWG